MKTRNIPKQFDTVVNLGFENLIVGGCSFTYNNCENYAVTWPYYLRDLGGFSQVYDFSMVGGGNTHTFNALIYGIECNPNIVKNSLIIVQIAGHDRDDYIIDPMHLNNYPFNYYYDSNSVAGITGGQGIANFSNRDTIQVVKEMKNHQSRSIENFVKIFALYTYLKSFNENTLFFEYRDYSLPGRDQNFDPKEHLPTIISKKYSQIITEMPENFYKFCIRNDLLEKDDFHPSPDGHLAWTRKCLLPYLVDKYSTTCV